MFAGAGLVYASILPVQFRYLPLKDAWQQFSNIPWLDLGVGRRADWVANGLAILPFGFLAAGACDARGKTNVTYLAKVAAVRVSGAVLVTGIEFLQVWYPIRTKSLNDVMAGMAGAFVGPLLWPLIGRPLLRKAPNLSRVGLTGNAGVELSSWLLAVYCICLAGYSALPLDIMLHGDEWQAKAAAGRFEWAPYSATLNIANPNTIARTLFEILKSGLVMIPVGMLGALALPKRRCVLLIFALPTLLEILQVPIFTRHAVYSDVLSGWMGGLAGIKLMTYRQSIFAANQHVLVRFTLLLATTATILWLFLGSATDLRSEPEIAAGWSNFFTPPFAKYYFMDEFNAFSNAAGKAIAFLILGFLTANVTETGSAGRPSTTRKLTFFGTISLLFLLAAFIELSQLYLIPYVGDASDVFLYTLSGGVGWSLYRPRDCICSPTSDF